MNKISQINYDSLQETTTSSLERWTALPISMIGRINILKMNILPTFIYSKTSPYPLPLLCLLELLFYFSSEKVPAWIDLKSCSVRPRLPFNLFLYSADRKSLRKNTVNPIVLDMIDIWFDTCKYLNINPSWSRFSPIWGNAIFKPGSSDPGFRTWAEKGLSKVEDMYRKDNIFVLFRNINQI